MAMPAAPFTLCADCRTDPPHQCAEPDRCSCPDCHPGRFTVPADPAAYGGGVVSEPRAPAGAGFNAAGAPVPVTRNARAREGTTARTRPRAVGRRRGQGTGRGGHGWVGVELPRITAADRPTRRSQLRRAEVDALMGEGRLRDAFNVVTGGVQAEIAKIGKTRAGDAEKFWRQLIPQFLDLADQVANSAPDEDEGAGS